MIVLNVYDKLGELEEELCWKMFLDIVYMLWILFFSKLKLMPFFSPLNQ